MLEQTSLAPGTRVRVVGQPIGAELQSPTGVIVGPGDYDGYFIIQLDQPARYSYHDGRHEMLPQIVEFWDNIEVE